MERLVIRGIALYNKERMLTAYMPTADIIGAYGSENRCYAH